MSSENTIPLSGQSVETQRRFLLVDVVIRLFKEKPLGAIGGIIVLLMLLVGIFADLLAPYGMNENNLADRLEASSAQHILGTDNLGRDQLTRIIYGARISMIVGLGGASINLVVAMIIGLLSGYIGGTFDMVVQRFVDARICFPSMFFYLTLVALTGPGILQLTIVLGVLYGIQYSRVLRSAVIAIKENVYISAAVAVGCKRTRIIASHIMPNVMAPLIIIFTASLGWIILSEATLSFLGYGIPPPNPSWGGMLSEDGRRFMYIAPHLAVWPGVALALAVFGINMLGDAIRDILDPRLRGGLGRYGRVKVKKQQGNKAKA